MMKKNIFYSFLLLLTISLVFVSCDKEDEFDYANYEPVVISLTSDFTTTPMVGRTYTFKAPIRGGSSFDWTFPTGVSTQEVDEEATVYAYIEQAVEGDFVVSVTETAMGGVSSAPKTTTTIITEVKPFTIGSLNGLSEPLQAISSEYSIGLYNSLDAQNSTFSWEVTGGTVTPTAGAPYKAAITFADLGPQTITVTEENAHGLISSSTTDVEVFEFCSLDNGLADLVGTWSGVDAWYDSEITTELDGDELTMSGINAGFMFDWWAEEIIEGGTVTLSVNQDNGTFEIPHQYIFTTEYDGDPYIYEIAGSGRWNNCGASPTIIIQYEIYYEGEDVNYVAQYSPAYLPTPYFTAEITLDASKKASTFAKLPKRPFKK